MANPRVSVKQGTLEGATSVTVGGKNYFRFSGIPYAEPPLADLRFKLPVPLRAWLGVKNATQEGNDCAQHNIMTKVYSGSEDCLYLNVYSPKLPSDKDNDLLPVMVYIHGGGFINGSGSAKEFGPDFIIEQETILVSVNYRLGPLGFLCLDIPEAPGNVGLRDQNLAMQWVQENIKFFSGDKDNVTIFGISAGSASVEYHMLSPTSRRLFHKAILQSGSSLNPWAGLKNPSNLIEKIKNIFDIKENDKVELLNELKSIEVEKLILACTEMIDKESCQIGEIFGFTPVVEKTLPGVVPFLSESPLELLRTGRFANVPTITGFCEEEGELMRIIYEGVMKEKLSDKGFVNFIPPSFKVDRQTLQNVFEKVYTCDKTKPDTHANNFVADLILLGGVYTSARNRIKFNSNDDYFYMFKYSGNLNFTSMNFEFETKNVSQHSDDLGYIATASVIDESLASSDDLLVRKRMVKMWTDFAKTGNPTPEDSTNISIKWLPFTDEQLIMEIGKELQMKTMNNTERMELWEKLYMDK